MISIFIIIIIVIIIIVSIHLYWGFYTLYSLTLYSAIFLACTLL